MPHRGKSDPRVEDARVTNEARDAPRAAFEMRDRLFQAELSGELDRRPLVFLVRGLPADSLPADDAEQRIVTAFVARLREEDRRDEDHVWRHLSPASVEERTCAREEPLVGHAA